jgi:hypothetical protein
MFLSVRLDLRLRLPFLVDFGRFLSRPFQKKFDENLQRSGDCVHLYGQNKSRDAERCPPA